MLYNTHTKTPFIHQKGRARAGAWAGDGKRDGHGGGFERGMGGGGDVIVVLT